VIIEWFAVAQNRFVVGNELGFATSGRHAWQQSFVDEEAAAYGTRFGLKQSSPVHGCMPGQVAMAVRSGIPIQGMSD
jgi:hypothetical protein